VVTLSLDTNVVIQLIRGRDRLVRQRFGAARDAAQPMVISLIVLHELRLGCALHPSPAAELARVEEFLFDLPIEPLDEPDVIAAARVGAGLIRAGRSIGPFDLLIGGQAHARDWTVVTANTREFERIDGLNVIDWTQGPD
jgi:tRNA(fMet)-specific endonuclease VapC